MKYITIKIIFSLLFTTLFSAQSIIAQTSYNDARLIIQEVRIQTWTGEKWERANQYETGKTYRLNFKMLNSSVKTAPEWLGRRGPWLILEEQKFSFNDIGIANIDFVLELGPAKFHKTNNNKTTETILKCNDNRGCPNVIPPSTIRWHALAKFTWTGPPSPVTWYPIDIETNHTEIVHYRPAPKGKIKPIM